MGGGKTTLVYSIPKLPALQFSNLNFGKSPAIDRFPKQKIKVRESVSGGRFPEGDDGGRLAILGKSAERYWGNGFRV